jgi:hypothetical protein
MPKSHRIDRCGAAAITDIGCIIGFAHGQMGAVAGGLTPDTPPGHGIGTDHTVKMASAGYQKAEFVRMASRLVRGAKAGEMSVYPESIDMLGPTGA